MACKGSGVRIPVPPQICALFHKAFQVFLNSFPRSATVGSCTAPVGNDSELNGKQVAKNGDRMLSVE